MRGCSCRGTAGFVHVSCLAEQAKILVAEAEEKNLDDKGLTERFQRWRACSLCEQRYHGVVYCALGWACWKTYVGRPETDWARRMAMGVLGGGLTDAKHHGDALFVYEAELSVRRRMGSSEWNILAVQSNLANTYQQLGRSEEALHLKRDVYRGQLKITGEGHRETLGAAHNYATSLIHLLRFEEAKSVLRKTIPIARRVVGDSNAITLKIRYAYGVALYQDDCATLDDTGEAVTTLEDIARTARRVLGGAHPTVKHFEEGLRDSQAALEAREAGCAYSYKIRFA